VDPIRRHPATGVAIENAYRQVTGGQFSHYRSTNLSPERPRRNKLWDSHVQPLLEYNHTSQLNHGLPVRGKCRNQTIRSHIHIRAKRIILDEFAAGLDHIAHQLGEDVVGLVDLLDLHLQEGTFIGVERGLPELIRVHLAETFVTLKLDAFAAGCGNGLEQADRTMNGRLGILAAQHARLRIRLLQSWGIFVELASVGRAEQRVIDDGEVLDAAHRALEDETFAFAEAADPATLDLVGQGVETSLVIFGLSTPAIAACSITLRL
jgi:hypothetical protein